MIRRLRDKIPATARALLLAAAGLLASGTGTMAQSLLAMDETLDDVRGWDIGVNTAVSGCLAKARYEDKTTVWFGFGGEDKKLFFGLSNPRWRSVQAGKRYEVVLIATNAGRWNGTFTGGDAGDEKSLVATNLKEDFMVDIGRAGSLDVRFQGKSIARLSLSGSMAALGAVIDCQKTLLARGDTERRAPPPQSRGSEAKGGGSAPEDAKSSGTGFFVSTNGHILTDRKSVV